MLWADTNCIRLRRQQATALNRRFCRSGALPGQVVRDCQLPGLVPEGLQGFHGGILPAAGRQNPGGEPLPQGKPDGPLKEAKGKAEIVDPATHAKLKVWFFWPFKGNYWIIDLDENYQWVVVGEPSRNYLWILSRTPAMNPDLYHPIAQKLPRKGYDPEKLRRTVHQDEWN